MAYNGAHPTSGAEHIICNIENDDQSMGIKDLDFINDWVSHVTVENEIWRGKKLREKKPLPKKRKPEYEVVNVDFMGTPCNENQRHGRKGKTITPRSRSPFSKSTFASNLYPPVNRILRTNTGRMKPKRQKKCSMRIAELAVPTKRQCIDTWRNKSYILPEFMVDRLKQHVMDQRPIVQIPEALYCFQRRNPQPPKNCCFKTTDNKNNVEVFKPLNRMDTRALCIIFGHKIAKRLSTPLNLTLNSKLEHLSRIVASDIDQITTPHNKNYVKNCNTQLFLTDVSEKVTIWIADILEDLSFKLLEEDLRVIKENEAKAKTAEQLVTVLEKVLRQEQKIKSTDLEEEEGPVLDFIDDIVDNVMNICEPEPVYIGEDSESSESSKDELMEQESDKSITPTESTENKNTMLEQIFDIGEGTTDTEKTLTEDTKNLLETDDILTDSDHFRKEINNLIDNIEKESRDGISQESADGITEVSRDEFNKELGDDNSKEFGDDNSKESEDDILTSQKAEMENNENTEEIDDISKNIKQNDENEVEANNPEKNDSNVSEVFELFTEDSGDDKNSKKVKFSVTDLVNPEEKSALIKIRTVEEPKHDDQEKALKSANNHNLKSSIIFAKPNEHLLSNADELWPADLTEKPLLKLSESVSKSVTSLGNITENEEKQFTPTEGEEHEKQKTIDTVLQEMEIIDNIKNTLHFNINDSGNQTKEALNETTTASLKTSETKVDLNELDGKTVDSSLFSTKAIDQKLIDSGLLLVSKTDEKPSDISLMVSKTDEKPFDKSLMVSKTDEKPTHQTSKKPKTYIGKRDLIKNGRTAIIGGKEYGKIPTHKSQSQMDYGWKVHPKTAPSWVTSWGQDRGEPSEDSIPIQMSTKVTENDMRKWAKDLEKGFLNLEMWSNWIDSTCKETGYLLKRKETACAGLSRKNVTDWIRLKKNINKDAILWTKLYQRTEDNFKTLRRKYHNIEYSPTKPKPGVHKAIFETMCEFESLCLELHRKIVSAEFCTMCTCKKTKAENIQTTYEEKYI